ncbi:hypothetical protein SBBP2_1470002 [Burkholderiales bacterium]|nr:hypothetical protein SBBP2_1470002 [Burkholderiales bacterium]
MLRMESHRWINSRRSPISPCPGAGRRSNCRRWNLPPVASACCGCGSGRDGALPYSILTRPVRKPGALPCRAGPRGRQRAAARPPVGNETVDRPANMVDMVYGLRGSRMPSDYRFELWSALRCALPWVDQESAVGIVGIRLTQTGGPSALLARRAKPTRDRLRRPRPYMRNSSYWGPRMNPPLDASLRTRWRGLALAPVSSSAAGAACAPARGN